MRTTRLVASRVASTLLPLALALLAPSARAEDTQPPEITHTPVTHAEAGHAIKVTAKITDASKFFPQVFYKWDGAAAFEKPLDMKPAKSKKAKHMYEATIPSKGTASLEYYIEAYDEFGNGPARSGSPEAPNKVEVATAAVAEAPPEAPPTVAPAAQETPAVAAAEPPKAEEPAAEPPPKPEKKVAPAAVASSGDSRPSSSRGSSGIGGGRTWTWVVGGAGVGVLLGGALTGLAFKKADDAYSARLKDPTNSPSSLQAQYDANKTLGTTSTILLVSGIALIGGGVALYFLEPVDRSSGKRADNDPKPEDKGVSFAAAPVPGGAAAVVAGRF